MGLTNALVTGASAGIGREIVRQLVLHRGMTVVATARRRERLEELAGELPSGKVLIEEGDLADASFRARLWDRAESLPGGCHLLVNNAGLGNYSELWDQDFGRIEEMVEVNFMAVVDLTQRAIRSMLARRSGEILQISSVVGEVGMPYSVIYVASKHAVNGLVKSARYELKGTGVRMWAACPARTVSEFQAVALGKKGEALEGHKRFGSAADTAVVVHRILRNLEGRRGFVYPSFMAHLIVGLSHWAPGPFEWFMMRWSQGYFRHEIEKTS